MSATIQIAIATTTEEQREQLIAELSSIGFDAFEEKDNELLAFIETEKLDEKAIKRVFSHYNVTHTTTEIEDQNWNALWESNFDPVIVEDFCAVRAHFHDSIPNVKYEILITPKMSFGTGHHATTYMMMSEMRKLNFKDKTVADFGTGTGVLAILAEKLGSKSVWAIDNDDWSITNATENIEKNCCKNTIIEKKDGFKPAVKFDIILANINKNVLLASAAELSIGSKAGGFILLSGLLKADEEEIISAFVSEGFLHQSTIEKSGWICLLLQHS